MQQIIITIERSKDLYCAYSEDVEGVTGCGGTIAQAKQSVLECIKIIQDTFDSSQVPAILKNSYKIQYRVDVASLLEHYKNIFTSAALERLTGINQEQLQQYTTGHRKPRQEQRKKIQNALHLLGQELAEVEL